MSNPEHPDLVSTAEVAAAKGVAPRTIHRMVARGQLKPYMRGPGITGAYLFRREDVALDPAAEDAA